MPLLFSHWIPSSDKLIEASSPSALAIASPSLSIHNEINNVTNIIAPTVAVAVEESKASD